MVGGEGEGWFAYRGHLCALSFTQFAIASALNYFSRKRTGHARKRQAPHKSSSS